MFGRFLLFFGVVIFIFGCKKENVTDRPVALTYTIFPNPFVEAFTINGDNITGEIFTVTVLDAEGKKASEAVVREKGRYELQVHLGPGNQGMYHVEFTSASARYRESVIKQ